jgi:DHA1 family bicyclomycin/chloramphenicol resistance-like MFS transporter
MLVNGLAPILAPLIGGQILRVTTWRGVFVVLTVMGIILLLAALFGLHETLPRRRRQTGGVSTTLATFGRLLTDRSFMGFGLSSGLAFASMFCYIAGSPFVLENIYGASPQLFGLFFGTNALGIVAASQLSRRLVDPVGPGRLLAAGLGISAFGGILLLAVVLLGIGLPGVLPALFLVVSSIGLIAPNATALALADHPGIAGSASALVGVLQYVIGALVAPLVGIGGSGTAVPMATLIAVLSTGGVVIFLVLARE